MPTEQLVEKTWDDLPLEEIERISNLQVNDMMTNPYSWGWETMGMHNIVLLTTGRKSGNEHAAALPIWRDQNGDRIVVASFQGAENHPAWYLNLRDRGRGMVLFLSQDGLPPTDPEILMGDEYDRIWSQLVEDRAWYADYQLSTDRQIPLVRLPELGLVA